MGKIGNMKYRLQRQEITEELFVFASAKVKKNKIVIPRASKSQLRQIKAVCLEIQKNGIPSYLVRKKLRGKLGFGIFLHPKANPIAKGDVIGPYSGEVYLAPQNQGESSDYAFSILSDLLLTKEEQLKYDPENRYHPRRLYALDLDAAKKGNFTRFINHSENPNVEAELLRIPANFLGHPSVGFEIIYQAKKEILPGEQLLISYEGEDDSYWGALKIKPFPMDPQTFRLDPSLKIIEK